MEVRKLKWSYGGYKKLRKVVSVVKGGKEIMGERVSREENRLGYEEREEIIWEVMFYKFFNFIL